ncbi:hypothetical protein ABT56_17310 [Photobacterium aquae]|uniref:Uncharacterized protein n=1 Tax=Photobacterium aquae TaxID=1195763 RepID=A0A0J1JNN1_9GAMM|nr:hypothetical protein [Photobacterium aquae]KLV03837.1 hypothetical protein ABT56_17310 [Photobacterium aquae]
MVKFLLLSVVGLVAVMFVMQGTTRSERVSMAQVPPPSGPSFAVGKVFDGDWVGRRIDVSGDKICLQTRIVGTIKEGNVTFRLMYNNTQLKGWVSAQGKLDIYADNPRWGYRFTGNVIGDRIEGEWKVTNAPCHGTWYIEKTIT